MAFLLIYLLLVYLCLYFTFIYIFYLFISILYLTSLEPRTSDRVLILGEVFLDELDQVLDLVKGFIGGLKLVLDLVEGFLEERKLVLVELFCLLVQQLWCAHRSIVRVLHCAVELVSSVHTQINSESCTLCA
jgi:hypothetical protein